MTEKKNHQSFRKDEVVLRKVCLCRLEGKNRNKYNNNYTYPTTVCTMDTKNMNRTVKKNQKQQSNYEETNSICHYMCNPKSM